MGAGRSLSWIPLGSSRCASGQAKSSRSVNGSFLSTSLAIWDLCQPASEILRWAPPEFALEGLKVTPHPSLAMLPLDLKSPAARVEGTLVQEPTLVTTGDRWLPHPYGHFRHRGADLLVHSVKGPAGAFTGVPHPLKAHGGILIPHDAGGVRALTDGEVLACQGVYPQALPEQITADHRTFDEVGRPWSRLAGCWRCVGTAGYPPERIRKDRQLSGPDELLADQQLQIWLEAWKRNKENPRQELNLVPTSWEPPTPLPSAWTDTERCGGTPRKRADHSLVVPRMLGKVFCLLLTMPQEGSGSRRPRRYGTGSHSIKACRFNTEILRHRLEAMAALLGFFWP